MPLPSAQDSTQRLGPKVMVFRVFFFLYALLLHQTTERFEGFSKGFRRCPDSNHQRGHSPLQWGRRGGAPRKTGQRWRARLRGAQQVSRRPAGRGGAVRCAAHCPATWARCGPGPAARRAGPSVGPRTDVQRAVCAACVRARAASRHGVVDLRHGGRLCGGLQSSRHCAALPSCCSLAAAAQRASPAGCAPRLGVRAVGRRWRRSHCPAVPSSSETDDAVARPSMGRERCSCGVQSAASFYAPRRQLPATTCCGLTADGPRACARALAFSLLQCPPAPAPPRQRRLPSWIMPQVSLQQRLCACRHADSAAVIVD